MLRIHFCGPPVRMLETQMQENAERQSLHLGRKRLVCIAVLLSLSASGNSMRKILVYRANIPILRHPSEQLQNCPGDTCILKLRGLYRLRGTCARYRSQQLQDLRASFSSEEIDSGAQGTITMAAPSVESVEMDRHFMLPTGKAQHTLYHVFIEHTISSLSTQAAAVKQDIVLLFLHARNRSWSRFLWPRQAKPRMVKTESATFGSSIELKCSSKKSATVLTSSRKANGKKIRAAVFNSVSSKQNHVVVHCLSRWNQIEGNAVTSTCGSALPN
eukprot:284815382_1